MKLDRETSRLANQSMAFILAGGKGSRLQELTEKRSKPAMYFGGKSRIIDFALSNAVNSGIRRIGVATQYKAHSLIRHLQRGWSFFREERNEYLDILPASQRMDNEVWYKGTSDAIYQNIDILESYGPKYMVILAGDHIYKQDYGLMVRQHVETGADVTIGSIEVPIEEASAFGVMKVDENDNILEFVEKPENPPSMPGDPTRALASMGIYVFESKLLYDMLRQDADNPDTQNDFGKDIIPYLVKHGKAVAHPFSHSCIRSGLEKKPYWRDVGTIDAFWEANIDLTDFVPELDIYDNDWPIWTHQELQPPAKFIHDEEGRRGQAVSSMVSGGCIISGSSLNRCLLFTGVKAHSFSSMEGVVALPHAEINRNAELKNVVIDRDVKIPAGLVVGQDPVLDAQRFRRTDSGICLITQSMINKLDL
ncbi:glucose-1-phosphate adenylyltransferase [Cohaesibacter celericrescens]|uniref:Glucose-1-phosphate adenylyltransferase n=1 Tax=Cohaesibacter celericrescens TaxID=2067669 RepID=A0A2N5XW62_9HYPH|nr:glucose-1-phosphate adenylyltransferase [Cohaesibacter celericrescens]PLW78665.1 glucose-1-phosphate adenylyltransferase [Cohaesibacter celericrescens]